MFKYLFLLFVFIACSGEPAFVPNQAVTYAGSGVAIEQGEGNYPDFCRTKESIVTTRTTSTTGMTLIVEIITDAGAPALLADSCVELLQTNVQPFWNETLCPELEICPLEFTDNVTVISYTVAGTPPTTYPGSIDWFEQNAFFPALAQNNLSLNDYDAVFVMAPPGVYGWEGLYTLSKVIWLNTRLVNFSWGQVLAHEVGHYLGRSHSPRHAYANCVYNPFSPLGGDDVMGGLYKPVAASHRAGFGILTVVPVSQMSVGDTVRAWVPELTTNVSVKYADRWYMFYRTDVDKVVIQEGTLFRQGILATEGTTYITNDHVKIVVGPKAEYLESIGLDPLCVNAIGEGTVLVTLVQLDNQCD